MKKHLNTTAVINELKGASVFFPTEETKGAACPPSTAVSPESQSRPVVNDTVPPARAQESNPRDILDEIKAAIKEQGKEVSYVRLTQAEKNQLSDIIYSYKRQGIKTTETEIGRIAINYLIEDYTANGKASILSRLLASLHG